MSDYEVAIKFVEAHNYYSPIVSSNKIVVCTGFFCSRCDVYEDCRENCKARPHLTSKELSRLHSEYPELLV